MTTGRSFSSPAATSGRGNGSVEPDRGDLQGLWLPALLCLLTLVLAMARQPAWLMSSTLESLASFESLPPDAQQRTVHVLLVPLGAMIVVFFRLTLGLQMLGPFRPILIAVALRLTGIVAGISLVLLTMGFVLLVRPRMKRSRLPYFGRLAVLLVCAVTVVMAMLLTAMAMGWESLERAVFFPIVVLGLTADGFARILARDGAPAAAWRGGVTLLVALVIAVVAGLPGVRQVLFEYPELVLAELGLILFIAGRGQLRLLDHLNPRGQRPEEDYVDAVTAPE